MSAHSNSFDAPDEINFGELPDSHLETQRMWCDVQKVHRATEELMELGGYEGNWRDMVVNPLLDLAIGHFGLEDQMTVSNVYVTIARFRKESNVSTVDGQNSDMIKIDPDDLRPCDLMNENKKFRLRRLTLSWH